MDNAPAPDEAHPVPDQAPVPDRQRLSTGTIALLFALIAVAASAWQWYDGRVQLNALRQELARKIAQTDVQQRQDRAVANEVRAATKEVQAKLGVLESKLADAQAQQSSLETLYQELTRNRDDWTLAEIEQSLVTAGEQLQLAGNVKGALIALQNADARLQRMDNPQLAPLRTAINQDIERLKAVPYVDVVGISARLDALISAVDTFPLAMDMRPVREREPARPGAPVASPWLRFAHEVWNETKQLVRIQRSGKPQAPLLAPREAYFLRQNLKLRLIGARLALLTRNEASYKEDLDAARAWLARYYDTSAPGVSNAETTLRTLHDSSISIKVPDISATLDALRAYRRLHERSGR